MFWLCNREFDAGRGDLFYLAGAFLDGRTWLDFRPGPYDVIPVDGRFYVPFPPFPAIAFVPLVALVGARAADLWESGINALLAGATVGMCWWLVGRLGVERIRDRLALVLLFGFSTQILWVTTRGGVWHTGHLIATILTFGCLIELWGRQRALLVGLLAGAAFLTRPPLAFAVPFYALLLEAGRSWVGPPAVGGYVRAVAEPWLIRQWILLGIGVLPSIAFFFWYNAARFGDPLESGYALAALPDWLAAKRDIGLFSLRHVPMNVELFLLHMPTPIDQPPYFRPDGLGMSVLLTSPGLLLAAWAPWRSTRSWLLLAAAIVILVPSLLYYGGGWLQYGYRYFLDSIPFVIALCAMGSVRLRGIGPGWWSVIGVGIVVNVIGVYWAYNI